MLSIISDLHLSDESTAFNTNGDAFKKIFKKNVLDSAKDNQAKELKIILLGDIFDFVRTDFWVNLSDPDERPWNGNLSPLTGMNDNDTLMKMHYSTVLNKIFSSPSVIDFINCLNEIKTEIRNDPNLSEIPVEIIYIIGNHDRVLNNFVELQNMIKAKLDKYDPNEIKFENSFYDIENYTVICRHGHEYDEQNYGRNLYAEMNDLERDKVNRFQKEMYAVQSIGEVITAELMSGMIYRLSKSSAGKTFVNTVKDINNVRPMYNAFVWLDWFGNSLTNKTNKKALMSAFKKSLKAVLDSKLGMKWDEITNEFWLFSGDITDRFDQLLEAIGNKDFDEVANLVEIFKPVISFFSNPEDKEFEEYASKVFSSGVNKDVQYVLMGHTHIAGDIYFKGYEDEKVNMYINTGTFLPLISSVNFGRDISFVSTNQLCMVNIYRRDEDLNNGKPNLYPTLDLWNGKKKKSYNK